MMRTPWTIAIIVIILTIGMLGFWASVLKHSSDILEFDHPSSDIRHSIKKGIFIDTLDIVATDTIKTNRFERVDILPKSSWIEKMTYWRSGAMVLDSIGLSSDTVVLIVNFRNFINGKPWAPENSAYYIVEFQDGNGNDEGVYIDERITRLSFKIGIDQIKDTIRLTTKNDEKIVLTRGRVDYVHQ